MNFRRTRSAPRLTTAVALAGLLSATIVSAGPAQAEPASQDSKGMRVVTDAAGRIVGISAATGETLRAGTAGTPAEQALAHLAAYAGDFGVTAADFTVEKTVGVATGTSVRLQQRIDGVPVLGAQLVTVLDRAGALSSIHGNVTAASSMVAADPDIEAADVKGKARKSFAKESDVPAAQLTEEAPELAWFDPAIWAGTPSAGELNLVWSVTAEPTGLVGSGGEILYDADTGEEVLRLSHKHEATNRAICDANSTYVSTSATCRARNAARVEGGAATGVTDVDDAYALFGSASDFYAANFGYDLTANIGSKASGDNTKRLRAIVRACVAGYGCPMENAFWNGKGMTFGPGFASADDVIAHELTHGVTEFTSGLEYSSQSGAINESISDVFGEYVDLTNGLGTDTAAVRWDMGEDLPASIGTIRSMSDPTRFADPDKVSSSLWYTGTSNSAYVHINSGVGNKAAFLMADGGAFNGQTVTGLGIAKAAQIWWQVENTLTSSATYAELNTVLPDACRALASAGTAGITEADCAQVDAVVLATEMHLTPRG